MKPKLTRPSLIGLGLFAAWPAVAQQPTPVRTQATALEEVVVTARKREESVQDIPATINVFSEDTLAQSGIVNSYDLQNLTPGLSIAPANRETSVAIRGVSNNVRSLAADPSNAIHLDGVYLPRSSMVLTELYDIERIEVLKGPQGSLYGRNATGGAINLVTRAAGESTSVGGFIGAGSNELIRVHAAAGGGNETLGVRLAVAYAKDDGYTENLESGGPRLDDVDFRSARLSLRASPSDTFSATFGWQHTDDKSGLGYGLSMDPGLGSNPFLSYAQFVPASEQRASTDRIRIDGPNYSRRKGDVANLTLDWDLGDVAFKSITGYTRFDNEDAQDTDRTGQNWEWQTTATDFKSYSQEFQLVGQGAGAIDWIVGAFLYRDEGEEFINYVFNLDAPTGVFPFPLGVTDAESESRSYAAFGQLTYRFAHRWAAVIGGRYTADDKEATSFATATSASTIKTKVDDSEFTPTVQLQYSPTSDMLLYFGASNGYKSGGINTQDPSNRGFAPESLWAYEAGLKSTALDGRLLFNAAAFYYDYSDIQLRTAIVGPTGGITVAVSNASSAKNIGAELQTVYRVTDAVTLDANVGYLDSKLENFRSPATQQVLDDVRLPLSPEWSGVVGLSFEPDLGVSGRVRARAEYSFRSSIIFPLTFDKTYKTDDGYGMLNATVRWTAASGRYYAELIGRNLTDEEYRTSRNDFLPFNVEESFGALRTFEIRFGVEL